MISLLPAGSTGAFGQLLATRYALSHHEGQQRNNARANQLATSSVPSVLDRNVWPNTPGGGDETISPHFSA